MKTAYLVILVTLILTALSAPLSSKKVVLALNCGTRDITLNAVEGFKYRPDAEFVDGDSHQADYTTNSAIAEAEIKFSFDEDVYKYERHTYGVMTYRLPIKAGVYTIILKFAEMYFTEPKRRVFDVKLGNKVIFRDLDVYAQVGRFAALDKYIEVEVKADGVYHEGQLVDGAFDKKKLTISFNKGKADNPIVQGIVVYNTPLAESNQNQYLAYKKAWNQQKEMKNAKRQQQEIKELMAVQNKKEKIVIRNDKIEIEEEEETKQGGNDVAVARRGWVRELLMSPLGVLVEGVIIAWSLIFIYQNVFLMRATV